MYVVSMFFRASRDVYEVLYIVYRYFDFYHQITCMFSIEINYLLIKSQKFSSRDFYCLFISIRSSDYMFSIYLYM